MSSRTSQAPTSGSQLERDSDSQPGAAWTRPPLSPAGPLSGLNCPILRAPASLPPLLIYFLSNWIEPIGVGTLPCMYPLPQNWALSPGTWGLGRGEPGSCPEPLLLRTLPPAAPNAHTDPLGAAHPPPSGPTHIPEVRAPLKEHPLLGCRATGLHALQRQGLGSPLPPP